MYNREYVAWLKRTAPGECALVTRDAKYMLKTIKQAAARRRDVEKRSAGDVKTQPED